MALKLNIDVAKIAAEFKELASEVEQDLIKAVGQLAPMTHARVAEMASDELSSSLHILQGVGKDGKRNLDWDEISPGIWVVTINEDALWIEDGISPGKDMKKDLLKNATDVSKDGHKYRPIPFDHAKPPSQSTPKAQEYVAMVRKKLKEAKIPFKKIEKNKDGSPRIGKLHKMDIESERPTARASHPALKGLTIYQSMDKSGNVRRDILTFRTVSESPKSKDKWIHPGYTGRKFLDRAAEWAMDKWEKEILPEVLAKWKG